MTIIEQVRKLRAELPRGRKDPWTNCCKSKRILLQRALKKKTLSSLTAGEYAAVQEWLAYMQGEQAAANREMQEQVSQITQITKQ